VFIACLILAEYFRTSEHLKTPQMLKRTTEVINTFLAASPEGFNASSDTYQYYGLLDLDV
jgi:hypothetical protein